RAMISLFEDGHIFNFANSYYYKHPTISSPETFTITDAEYNQFLQKLKDENYSLESETESLLKQLEEAMKDEQYYEDNSTVINELKTKIKSNQTSILEKHKELLKLIISNDIVGRYYYQKGKVIHRLHSN